MKENEKVNKPFRKFLPLFTIILSLILLMSASYAMLIDVKMGKNNYVIKVANLEVTFVDNKTDALVLENTYPMTDNEGRNQDNELVFSIKNTGTIVSNYDITIEDTTQNDVDFSSLIKFTTNKNNTNYGEPKLLSQDNYIDKDVSIEPNITNVYRVKAWLSREATSLYMDKTYKAKVVVQARQSE